MTSWPTNWVNWVTTFRTDRWQLFTLWSCERVDNSTSSWVKLCRYKRAFSRIKELCWTIRLLLQPSASGLAVSLLVSGLTVDILSTFCNGFVIQCVKLMLREFVHLWFMVFTVRPFFLSPNCNLSETFYQVWALRRWGGRHNHSRSGPVCWLSDSGGQVYQTLDARRPRISRGSCTRLEQPPASC